mmetsp:Transcript_10595/g.25596  ORF Transcript_10595/g.25596 Transcript_10595/m.25596 type:complete len:117 (+) Transcript_10595:695-1045(+)
MKVMKLSTTLEELKGLGKMFTKADIKRDLDHLRETHYPLIPRINNINATTRESLLELLCKWRKRYFKEFPRVYEQHLERSEAVEMNDNHTDYDTRAKELEHFIYSLEGDIVDQFRS